MAEAGEKNKGGGLNGQNSSGKFASLLLANKKSIENKKHLFKI